MRRLLATIVAIEKQEKQPECVFSVALGIQHAMRMRHIVFPRPAPLYNIFHHHLTQGTIFEGKKKVKVIEH